MSVSNNRPRGSIITNLADITNNKREIQAAFDFPLCHQRVSHLKVAGVANLPRNADVVVQDGLFD